MLERLSQLFEEALSLAAEDRARLLDRVAADEPEVACRLRAMLAADEGGVGLLDRPPELEEPPGLARSVPADGECIGGYRIERELGRGGQGTVYLARDEELGRPVALKLLNASGLLVGSLAERFRREAQVTSRLDHPSVCTVYRADVDAGRPYIAMRHVEGNTLAERIRAARADGERLFADTEAPSSTTSGPSDTGVPARREIDCILAFVEGCARTLHACHEVGVVHRDVKPGNVMVTPAGQPVLLDFGLARLTTGEEESLTGTGDILGTPHYMSPEQIEHGHVELDARTDVYSLGVVLYECLTLRRPFEAATREGVYRRILAGDASAARRSNSSVSRDLSAVVETAMNRDRRRRYDTALALAEDLLAVREHRPVAVKPVPAVVRLALWSRRRPALAAALLAAFLGFAAVAGLGGYLVANRSELERGREEAHRERVEDLLMRAHVELAEGLPSEAEALFGDVLELEPGSPEAVSGLALVPLLGGEPARSLAVLERHAGVVDRNRSLDALRAAALDALGRTAEARAVEAALPEPRTALDDHLRASLEMVRGEAGDRRAFDAALELARRAVMRSRSARLNVVSQWVHAAGHVCDADAAREGASLLTGTWPQHAEAWYWAGFALGAVGDDERALECLRTSERLRPGAKATRLAIIDRLISAGRIEEGLARCERLVADHEDYAGAWVRRVDLLLRAGRPDDAVVVGRAALVRWPRNPLLRANLGWALLACARLDEAQAVLEEGVRIAPSSSSVLVQLGNVHRRRGRMNEAVAAWTRAVELSPDEAPAHINLSVHARHVGRPEEALEHATAAVALAPDAFTAWLAHGQALHDLGRAEEALQSLRHAERLQPDHPRLAHAMGATLAALGRHDEAVAALGRGAEAHPDDTAVRTALGIAQRRAGRAGEALATFGSVLDARPDDPQAHVNVAVALHDLGRYDACRARAREAAALAPSWSVPHEVVRDAFIAERRFREAVDASRDALAAEPDDIPAMMLLGKLLTSLRDHEGAADAYRSVLAIDPGHVDARYYLGHALWRAGRNDRAVEELRLALHRRDVPAARTSTLGFVLMALERWDEAADAFELSVAHDDTAASREPLAECLLALGRVAEAADVLADSKGHPVSLLRLRRLAEQLLVAGRPASAVAARERALMMRPGNLEDALGRAVALDAAGRKGAARRALDELLRVAPKTRNGPPRTELVRLRDLIAEGGGEAAPVTADGLVDAALLADLRGRRRAAAELFRRAVERGLDVPLSREPALCFRAGRAALACAAAVDDPKESAAWRRRGLEWLGRQLDALEDGLEERNRFDADFVGDPTRIADETVIVPYRPGGTVYRTLPGEVRAAWDELWQRNRRVARALARRR